MPAAPLDGQLVLGDGDDEFAKRAGGEVFEGLCGFVKTANALSELLERARATGKLRWDFAHQDVPLILMANAGVVTATRDAAPEAWCRLLGYLLQSLATEAAKPLPDPSTKPQIYRALTRLSPPQQ